MFEELSEFLEDGYCHGLRNGVPIVFVADSDGGFSTNAGNTKVLEHLRQYERKKGTVRSYRDQFRRLIRADVAEVRARKKALGLSS